MALCVASGKKVQSDNMFCMHSGKRRLAEKKQTEELTTLTEFMGIKSEITRICKNERFSFWQR